MDCHHCLDKSVSAYIEFCLSMSLLPTRVAETVCLLSSHCLLTGDLHETVSLYLVRMIVRCSGSALVLEMPAILPIIDACPPVTVGQFFVMAPLVFFRVSILCPWTPLGTSVLIPPDLSPLSKFLATPLIGIGRLLR